MNINITLHASEELLATLNEVVEVFSRIAGFTGGVKKAPIAEVQTETKKEKPIAGVQVEVKQEKPVAEVQTEIKQEQPKKEKAVEVKEDKPKISEVELRAKFVELSKKGKREELKAMLTDLGVAKVSDLTSDQYDDTYARLGAM